MKQWGICGTTRRAVVTSQAPKATTVIHAVAAVCDPSYEDLDYETQKNIKYTVCDLYYSCLDSEVSKSCLSTVC